MKSATFRSTRLALLVGAAVVLVAPGPRAQPAAPPSAPAPPNPVARIFGVAPSSPRAELEELARRARVDCRPSAPVQTGAPPRAALPVVCTGALASPLPGTTTYWYEDDSLARAFLVDTGYARDIDEYGRHFELLRAWIKGALGAPTRPLEVPPGWSGGRPLSPDERMQQLVQGRVRLSVAWERPDATVELWLAGERGRPVLAVGVRRRGPPPPRCTQAAVTEALLDLFPPAPADARARSAALLAACKVTRAAGALDAALAHDGEPAVQAQAIRSLAQLGHAPPADQLARLAEEGTPPVAEAARETLVLPRPAPPAPPAAAPAPPPAPTPAVARAPEAKPAPEAPLYGPPTPAALVAENNGTPAESPLRPAALRAPPTLRESEPTPMVVATPAPPVEEKPSGPVSGVPLVIGASTVAGATLMRNISLWGGLTGVTPQLLLGSTGAVIGFGTSWGLSRFGIRPTVEQAAWYANSTAWGTLAGVSAWGVTGSTSDTAKYGWPVGGQAAGMALGVWSASKWKWTLPQTALADSLVVGAGLSSMGFDLLQDETPKLTLKDAIGMPVVMVGSAVATRYLEPTPRDIGLMTATAVAGGWTGGLLASGILSEDFLGSRQSWGGVVAGLGLGYLGGAAAGAFSEAAPQRLGVAGGGMFAGNALGLGLHLTIQGFSGEPGGTFTPDDVHARAVSAAIGGLLVSGAGYAYAPHLQPGPSAVSMTITGAAYGAGTWWLASAASYHGQPVGPVEEARLDGGMLTGATLGALTGLVTSRWFAPSGGQQLTAAGSTVLGMGAGLGVAKLVTDTKGTPDAVGVLSGAAIGLGGGIVAARSVELRAPEAAAGLTGMLEGLLVGRLVPTLREPSWEDTRATAGGTLLGMSLGAVSGGAAAHLTHATTGEVGVATTAGTLGLLAGVGAGYMLPCDTFQPCTSQAPRIGAVAGSLGLMGAAMALEPQLHLATTLGPDATTLAILGGFFGTADGLMLAGALDDGGTISGTSGRQGWGGVLAGASTELAAGLVASKYVRLRNGDALYLTSGKVTGGLFGLGAALVARDRTGAADTLATLTGSVAGVAAAGVVQTYTPLDGTDSGAAITGAAFGGFLGSLVPTLDEPHWDGIGHRKTGGAFLLGLSSGVVAGAAASHASDAQARDVGFTMLGGVDGMLTGLGVGLLVADQSDPLGNSNPSTRPQRTGMLVGTSAGLAVGALAWPRLHPDAGDSAVIGAGTGLGAWMGFWLPALGHADVDDVTPEKRWGGVLASAGLASIGTSLLTPALEVETDLVSNAVALDTIWSAAGAGAGALASTRDDAPVWGMLGAGTAGLVLGGALHRQIEIGAAEGPFLTLAAAEGTWLGGWIPSLTDAPTSRQRAGALALGGFGTLGLATVLSPVVKPSPDLIQNGAAVDALWTGAGAGAGLLFSTGDKAPVWSMLGAGVAGLTVGGALHESIDIGADDAPLLTLAGGEGAWLGAWIPSLFDSPSDRQRAGALMLGGFGAVGAATVLSPALHVDADVAENGAAVGALWTGAGAGAGLLFASGDKAPVWAHLGAGAGGLLLGGALHESIEIDHTDAPLLTLASGEGLWLGGWFPYLLHERDDVTDRERLGAVMLGGFGAAGLATITSGALELSPARAGYGALGSVIGSSLAGGIALMAPSLHDRAGVGLMLGGTTVGLATGMGAAPLMASAETTRLVGGAAAGAALGLSESLLFAWSGRADDSQQYAGAALVGGGVGATLGLAAAATPSDDHSTAPAAAGFAAWGGWVGSFTGSLIHNDTHDIVLGGLLGANAGFLAGFGVLKADLVEPRDFGWLSLFGALGTVGGAGVGAGVSKGNTAAIRAGLAIGPAVGMITGVLVLPKLRRSMGPSASPSGPTASARRARHLAATQTQRGDLADDVPSAADGDATDESESVLGRKLAQVGSVTDWAPMVGAMPAPAETGPAPVLFGVTGHWK